MASNVHHPKKEDFDESPLKKSKIEDGFLDEGSAKEPKAEDKDNKEWIDYSDEYKRELLKKYKEDFAASEGFEHDYWPARMTCPSTWDWLTVGERIHLGDDIMCTEWVNDALDFAVRKENEKGANLEVVKAIIATTFQPFLYYITFEAKDLTTKETKEYQTRVVWDPFTRSDADADVEIFRLRKDKKEEP
ncbi:uncharacterized protein LOC110630334 isoform X4 [Manihot esculenta]|uniref:Uncharacterized protein n=1 Tax=Manihot esculenta TaxID=3983 RepID=A0ACB7IE53_MANES|nr:uncharacterized protein LOC110630334 isoform X4 [Manihot esculenta]KAG8661361.1 hypothetical protein MANES_01G000248v8 [Manihot esculenta]